MWEDVPLSLPDREAIHRMYTRCYNVDAGVLHILQLMHGLQTGYRSCVKSRARSAVRRQAGVGHRPRLLRRRLKR